VSSEYYTAIGQQRQKNQHQELIKEKTHVFSQYMDGKRAEKMRDRERERALTTIRETSRGVSNYFSPRSLSVVPWSRRGEMLRRRSRRRRGSDPPLSPPPPENLTTADLPPLRLAALLPGALGGGGRGGGGGGGRDGRGGGPGGRDGDSCFFFGE
jgi:hypothetical protein